MVDFSVVIRYMFDPLSPKHAATELNILETLACALLNLIFILFTFAYLCICSALLTGYFLKMNRILIVTLRRTLLVKID